MKKVVVLIPVFNEELTIKNVILDFWAYPDKNKYDYQIIVIDNNSNDRTKQIALDTIEANEINGMVMFVKRQGKANAVKAAFREIDADVYVMIDGDSTYWVDDLDKFIRTILDDDIDMVTGDRMSTGHYSKENKRAFHGFGNSLVKNMINFIFKAQLRDIMTGYRSFSRRVVKNYPILCDGFELETDISIFCLEHKFNILEIPIKFTDRPDGSFSKLNTLADGFKVIMIIFNMFRNYKPLQFFSIIGLILLILGLITGSYPISDYIRDRYVYHVPMAILTVGLVITSFLSFAIALILSSVRRYQNINFEINLLNNKNR